MFGVLCVDERRTLKVVLKEQRVQRVRLIMWLRTGTSERLL
jgi:hypothetical protein